MNKLTATVCAAMLLAGIAHAQSQPCGVSDPTSVAVDTVRTTLTVASSGGDATPDSTVSGADGTNNETSFRAKAKSNGQITLEICIWRTQGGIVYSIAPGSIQFSGDGAVIDGMSTQLIFDLIAQAAVGKGHSLGYSSCPSATGDGGAPVVNNVVRVSIPSCVRRLGRGTGTTFESCDPGSCCVRSYSIDCTGGESTPVIRLISSEGSGCSAASAAGGCESLCE